MSQAENHQVAITDQFDFPQPRECPFDPPAVYRRPSDTAGLDKVRLWNGSEAWFVTRFADVRTVLRDRRFSADTRRDNFPHPSPGMVVARGHYRSFVSMDVPEHGPYRQMLTAEFARPRIDELTPQIEAMVKELIDDMLSMGPPADFLATVAMPLPSRVICLLMGVPYEDHSFFRERAEIMVSTRSTVEEASQASHELITEYLGDLLDQKAQEPGDDILSRLASGPLSEGKLSRSDVLSMARLLLVAGHETTANTACLSLVALFRNQDQLDDLCRSPEKIPGAVEELLRFVDPTHGGRRRLALEDVEVGGQLIRAGEAVVAHNPSADRDPVQFENPDQLDVDREVRQHMAFGDGIHRCLGNTLARAELVALFTALFDRVPDIRLAVPEEELQYGDDSVVYGVSELPVRWGPDNLG